MATGSPKRVWFWDGWTERQWMLAIGVILLILLVLVLYLNGYFTPAKTTDTKETATTQTAPQPSPSAPASAILPPPVASPPAGVIKEEKESVAATTPSRPTGEACVTQKELEESVGKLCQGKTKIVPKYVPRPAVAKAPAQKHPSPPVADLPPPVATLPPPPPSGRFWGWVHPEATVSAKRPCFADRRITGMPVQCSSIELFPREGNETEVDWNARVAAQNGIAVGMKGDKGTITGTRFERVEVK